MKYVAFIILIFLLLLTSLDAQGWYKTYNVTPFGEVNAVVAQTPDGGYLLAGETRSGTFDGALNNIIVVKTDQEGAVQWTKELDHVELGKSYTDSGPQVAVFNDGTFLVAANTFSKFGCNNFMIIWRLDPF
ncbi:MAG TPA: hypothetical protein VMZ69_11370, partial [Saprospiraceae bacterium]|nr:hypothetical protein [Saprospiraceae bacterium]